METPYAVAPQERRDWQGASRIMELLQENKRSEVRLARQTLCFVSPREREKRSTIGKKQSYNGAAPNL